MWCSKNASFSLSFLHPSPLLYSNTSFCVHIVPSSCGWWGTPVHSACVRSVLCSSMQEQFCMCWLCSQQLHMMLNHNLREICGLLVYSSISVCAHFNPPPPPHPPPPTPKSCTWWCRTTSWWRSTFCVCVYHSSLLSFAGTGTPVAQTYANVCWRFSTGPRIFSLASVLTGCGTTSWWRAMPPQPCVMSKHKLKEIHVLFLCTLTIHSACVQLPPQAKRDLCPVSLYPNSSACVQLPPQPCVMFKHKLKEIHVLFLCTLTLEPVFHCPHSCAWCGTTSWWRSTFCFCVYHSSSLSFAGTGTPVAWTYANVCWRFSTGLRIFSLASVLTGCGTTSWWRAMPPQPCVMSKHKLKEVHVLFLCTLTLHSACVQLPPQLCVMSKHKLKEIHVLFLCTLTLQPVFSCPHSCVWCLNTSQKRSMSCFFVP